MIPYREAMIPYIAAVQRDARRGRCTCCKLTNYFVRTVVIGGRMPVAIEADAMPTPVTETLCFRCSDSIRRRYEDEARY